MNTKLLTAIVGQPDFVTLSTLKKELKANAKSVPTTLGGGNHGHLGLVLSQVEYAPISPTHPFVEPNRPAALTFPARATSVQAKLIEVNHKKELQVYDTCISVKKVLVQQIVKAVNDTWLLAIHNPTTDSIEMSVPDVLAHLFREHGDVSPNSLSKRESEVKTMFYNPSCEPIDKIFNEVEKLNEYANAANSGYTMVQKINIAYVILKKQRVFNQAITEWNRLIRGDPTQNTWDIFKLRFRVAYRELKEVEELQTSDSQFNTANLVNEIVDVDVKIKNLLQHL